MLIVCPNCATSYDVDVASLRPDGRRVRCVRCRSIWHAELPRQEKLIAAAEALAPGAAEAAAATAEAAVATASPSAQFDAGANAAAELPAEPVSDPFAVPPLPDGAEAAEPAAAADESSVEVESPPIAPAEPEGEHAPESEAEAHLPPNAELPEDIESVAARRYPLRSKRKRLQWPLSRLQSVILALIVANAIIVSWRDDLVRAMPQTASFYAWFGLPVNVHGLDFDSLGTTTEQHEGVPILVITGNIINVAGKTEIVPLLRFAVRNAARQEIYSWTAAPPRQMLPPGHGAAFHTRLASPPPDSHDVLVRFVNRSDLLAGAR
jgi:predicted Zn finger-like uncharacterized protein